MYQLGMKLANLAKAPEHSGRNPEESESFATRARAVWEFINSTGILDNANFKVKDSKNLDI
jgi:hypothetical protein